MKKTTTFRQSALVGTPGMASGFVPSITNAIKISVNLRNVDIKIYGFTGSQWELLHDTDGLTNSYVTDVVHQKYYFESKTGVEQTVSASFLSSDSRNIEQPRFGVSRDTRKLHDIEEVPLYNSEDAGKFLTVMSDGSLAWLLETESYVVETEGGEEGGGAPAGPQASFIEDNAGFTGTTVDGIYTDGGDGQGHWSQIGLSSDGVIDYTNGDPTNDEFTISWWMNLNSSQAATNLSLAGRHLGSVNGTNRNFKINLGNVGAGITNPHFQIYLGSTLMSNLNTGVAMGDTWTHCAVVCKSDGSQLVISAYLNGNKLSGTRTKPLGTKLLLPEAYDGFGWGGNGQSGRTVKGQFDSMQIEDGIALTDAQVAAIAAQTDRQMGIEAASQI